MLEHLLPDAPTRDWSDCAHALVAWFDEARQGVVALLRKLYAAIDMPPYEALSRALQELLHQAGARVLNDHLAWVALAALLAAGAAAMMMLWRLLWTGVRVEKSVFNPIDRQSPKTTRTIRHAIADYLHCLTGGLWEGLILFLGTVVLTSAVLIYLKILWFSYLASPVGRFYPIYFPYRAQLIGMLLGQDSFGLPVVVTVIAFGVGIAIGALGRFFYLTRYVYHPRGMLGRMLLVALPLNVAAAALMRPILPHPHWGVAYAATLVPTLISFSFCFRFTSRLLPELGMFLRGFKRNGEVPVTLIFLQDLMATKKVIEFDPVAGKRTGRRLSVDDGVQPQGLFLSRRGHTFILYRYGRDLFFQVDDRELPLRADIGVKRSGKGRILRRFELILDRQQLFRLFWSDFSLGASQGPTAVFLDAMQNILESRQAYERAFIIEDDPLEPAHDFPEPGWCQSPNGFSS